MGKIRKCEICGFETKVLGSHLNKIHSISIENYYITYTNYKDTKYSNKCKTLDCSNITKFDRLEKGYNDYCSMSCRMKTRNKDTSFRNKASISASNKLKENHKKGIMSSGLNSKWIKSCEDKGILNALVYILHSENSFKIGISRGNFESGTIFDRAYRFNANSLYYFEFSIYKALEIENYIKSNYSAIEKTEIYSYLQYPSIMKYLESISTISKLIIIDKVQRLAPRERTLEGKWKRKDALWYMI